MYFPESKECPECGFHTHELVKAMSKNSGQRVLMCEGCYDDTDEALKEWDTTWDEEEFYYE